MEDPCFQDQPPQQEFGLWGIGENAKIKFAPWAPTTAVQINVGKRTGKSRWAPLCCKMKGKNRCFAKHPMERLSPIPFPLLAQSRDPWETENLKNNISISLWLQRYKTYKSPPSGPTPAPVTHMLTDAHGRDLPSALG